MRMKKRDVYKNLEEGTVAVPKSVVGAYRDDVKVESRPPKPKGRPVEQEAFTLNVRDEAGGSDDSDDDEVTSSDGSVEQKASDSCESTSDSEYEDTPLVVNSERRGIQYDDADDDDESIGPSCWVGQQLIGMIFAFVFGFTSILVCAGDNHTCIFMGMGLGGALGVYAMGTVFAENKPCRPRLFLWTLVGTSLGSYVASFAHAFLDHTSQILFSAFVCSVFGLLTFRCALNPNVFCEMFNLDNPAMEGGRGGAFISRFSADRALFSDFGFSLPKDYHLNARVRATLRAQQQRRDSASNFVV